MVCKYYLPRDVCRVYVRLGCRERAKRASERTIRAARRAADEENVTSNGDEKERNPERQIEIAREREREKEHEKER